MKRTILCGCMLALLIALSGAPCRAAPEPVGVDIQVEITRGGTASITASESSPPPDSDSLTVRSGRFGLFHIEFSNVGNFSYTVQVEQDENYTGYDETVYRVQVIVTEENDELTATLVVYKEGSDGKYVPPVQVNSHLVADKKLVPISFNNAAVTPIHASSEDSPTYSTGSQTPGQPDTPDNPDNTGDPNHTDAPNGSDGIGSGGDGSGAGSVGGDGGSPGGSGAGGSGTEGAGGGGTDGSATAESGSAARQPKTGDDSDLAHYLIEAILASAGLFCLSVLYLIDVERARKARARR